MQRREVTPFAGRFFSKEGVKRHWLAGPCRRCSNMRAELAAHATTFAFWLQSQQTSHGDSTTTEATKKSTGTYLLTFVETGSSTWARTRDLRVRSRTIPYRF